MHNIKNNTNKSIYKTMWFIVEGFGHISLMTVDLETNYVSALCLCDELFIKLMDSRLG